jgi:hypothetical protein
VGADDGSDHKMQTVQCACADLYIERFHKLNMKSLNIDLSFIYYKSVFLTLDESDLKIVI